MIRRSAPDPAVRREALRIVVRSVLTLVLLLAAYFLVPAPHDDQRLSRVMLATVATAGFCWVFVRQLRHIQTSPVPRLRAVEALVAVATLFVLGLAVGHLLLDASAPGSYSEPLDRMDSLYFTITVLATVGFGDITPVSTTARALTTVQMLLGVALVGAGVRLLFTVAGSSSHARDPKRDADPAS